MQSFRFPQLICLVILMLVTASVAAQKKYNALYLPPVLDKIQDVNSYAKNYTDILSVDATRGETKNELWMTVSDRAGTKTYDKPGGSKVEKQLKFKEGPFYVIDQNEEWVEIVKGTPIGKVGSNKVEGVYYGWVRKNQMLMWPNALRSGSGIHKFVFILLRTEDFEQIKKFGPNKAALYSSPTSKEVYDQMQIFDFYNVLKQEGDRYLIATLDDGKLPGIESFIGDVIIGWVDRSNTTDWNTRVVLEPNFTGDGHAERNGEKNLQLVGYADAPEAAQHARSGTKHPDGGKWESDPVTMNAAEMAKSDVRRYRGKVMRFPMLSSGATNANSVVFTSGVIGDVTLDNKKKTNDGVIAAACELLEKEAEDRKNINLMFAIQGTSNMKPYKDDLVDAIQNISGAFAGAGAKVRYGGVVYHNITDDDGQDESLAEVFPLSPSKEDFAKFVDRASFENKESDAVTNIPAANYGINRLLKRANLNKEHSNILIIIGSDGDFGQNARLLQQIGDHRANVDAQKLSDAVAAFKTQVFSVAITNRGRSGGKFLDLGQRLTSSSAVDIYNTETATLDQKYDGAVGKSNPPYLPNIPDELTEQKKILIEKSSVDGGLFVPSEGKALTGIEECLLDIGVIVKERVDADYEIYSSYCNKGKELGERIVSSSENSEMSTGNFTAQVQAKLARIIREVNISPEMLGDRYQLYEEVYFPRHIKGAEEPTMSYVLFMGTREVTAFIDAVNNIVNVASRQPPDMQRAAVVDLYAALYGFFTGDRNREKLLKNRISEVTSQMYGMSTDGLVCPEKAQYYCDLRLGDVLQEDIVSIEDVERILAHFQEVGDYLEKEVDRSDYDFIFTSRTGKEYYWVPLDYLY